MKALTIIQPWASLYVWDAPTGEPEKPDETRGWRTNFRGWLAVHAGKNHEYLMEARRDPFREVVKRHGIAVLGDFPRGYIVGAVEVLDCIPSTDAVRALSPTQRAFGDYSPGRFAWRRGRSIVLAEPIPCRGAQGLWDVPADVVRAVREQARASPFPTAAA